MSNHRWSKFWWVDYENDDRLAACSFAAQGLWMRMLCLMHRGEEMGCLVVAARPMTTVDLAKRTGGEKRMVERLVTELEDKGVLSRDARGVLFSRRMVRDEKISEKNIANGKLGGNPNLIPDGGISMQDGCRTVAGSRENSSEIPPTSKKKPQKSACLDEKSVKPLEAEAETETETEARKKEIKEEPPTPKPVKAAMVLVATLPPWIPLQAWSDFVENRRQIKKPLTPIAQKGIIRELEKFHREGLDIAASLEQSTRCSYTGVFPPKTERRQQQTRAPQKTAYQADLEAKLRDMGLMDMPAEPEDLMTINGSFEEAFR